MINFILQNIFWSINNRMRKFLGFLFFFVIMHSVQVGQTDDNKRTNTIIDLSQNSGSSSIFFVEPRLSENYRSNPIVSNDRVRAGLV